MNHAHFTRLPVTQGLCRLDGHKFRPRGKLAVDVGRHSRLLARRVQALVTLHVIEQASVVSAAARASDARSRLLLE